MDLTRWTDVRRPSGLVRRSGRRRSRVTQTGVLEHVVALGAQVRPMTVETTLDAHEDPEPEGDGDETWTFNPKVRLFPTRAELEAHALQETWGPIAQSVLTKLRLVSQHGLSLLARGQVCATIALSRCWYEASFNPPPDGCEQWKVIRAAAAMFFFTNGVAGLTVDGGPATAKFNHHIYVMEPDGRTQAWGGCECVTLAWART